jgi:hypothetical protein
MAVFVLNKQKSLANKPNQLDSVKSALVVVQGKTQQRSDGYAYFPQPTIALNKKETARQAA